MHRVAQVCCSSWTPAALIALQALLLAYGAWAHSPTVTEATHLSKGLHHLKTGRFDRNLGNPPLVHMIAAAPVLAAYPKFELHVQDYFTSRRHLAPGSPPICFVVAIARWACLPFSLFGSWVVWRWASRLYGRPAGACCLALWCFSPNQLAHGQLITCDAAATAFGLAAAYTFWRWLCNPSWPQMLLAGVALGLAELSKLVWVLLLFAWPLVWLVSRAFAAKRPGGAALFQEGIQLTVAMTVGIYIINAGYGFEKTCRPLSEYPVLCETAWGGPPPAILRNLRVPLPQNYLYGIRDVKRVVVRKERSYLAGKWSETGWWWYYAYAVAVKVPVGTLFLFFCASALSLRPALEGRFWRREGFPLLVGGGVFIVVSSLSNWSHHFRYALPALPHAYLFIAKTFRWIFGSSALRGGVAALALFASVSSSLCVYPHCLSFFNRFAGGPVGGRHHLVDSNLDWGQDLLYLKQWMEDHPEITHWRVAYYGAIDPHLVEIDYKLPPRGGMTISEEPVLNANPRTGWHAVSVNFVMGRESRAFDGDGEQVFIDRDSYIWFQQFRPIARAGYSIDIYHIPQHPKQARRQIKPAAVATSQ